MTNSKLVLLKYPLKFGATTAKKAHMLCGSCWAAAMILPIIAIIIDWQDVHFTYGSYECMYGFTGDIWHYVRPLNTIIFAFLPLCGVVTSTIYLLVIAKRVARRGRENLKWQGILTTILTATVYCISMLPYTVYRVGESVVRAEEQNSSFFHTIYYRFVKTVLYLNVISNFYIYSLTVSSFREFVRGRLRVLASVFVKEKTLAAHQVEMERM